MKTKLMIIYNNLPELYRLPMRRQTCYPISHLRFLKCPKINLKLNNLHIGFTYINSLTFKLPLLQYSVTIQILGGSVQAPMNPFKFSCLKSLI